MFTRKEMAARREAGINNPAVLFLSHITAEDVKYAKDNGWGYLYRLCAPRHYKQKDLYDGQSSNLDPISFDHYFGGIGNKKSKLYKAYNSKEIKHPIIKIIVGFYSQEDLNAEEAKLIKHNKPLYNVYHNSSFQEKNKKRIKLVASDFKPTSGHKTLSDFRPTLKHHEDHHAI